MTMDVYFDYGCPYCLRGFAYLQELAREEKSIELNFIPIEAHPRPETHGQHTDLCAQGMYVAMDMGVDVWTYHEAMFKCAINDNINIESAGVLSEAMAKVLSKKPFFDALQNNVYAQKVADNNCLAYDKNGVWAVPAFRLNGKALDSVEGVGVSFQALKAFMKEAVLNG